MRQFAWFAGDDVVPAACDLRRCGWNLVPRPQAFDASAVAILVDVAALNPAAWLLLLGCGPVQMRRTLLLGVATPAERARLLHLGFGEVLDRASLSELDARALRLTLLGTAMPRERRIGPLRLDLFSRDAFIEQRRVGLHPREFALLWRLAETRGVPVTRHDLLREVWRLAHCPETNRVAVHVFRLRAKLAVFGLSHLIVTARQGGYYLALETPHSAAAPLMLQHAGLDERWLVRDGASEPDHPQRDRAYDL